MPQKFTVGDVVCLASGSDDMTVTGYLVTEYFDRPSVVKDDETMVNVTWYKNGKLESATLHEDTLETTD